MIHPLFNVQGCKDKWDPLFSPLPACIHKLYSPALPPASDLCLPAPKIFPSSCAALSCLPSFTAVTVSPAAGEILASSTHTKRSLTPPVISAESSMGQTTALPGSWMRVHGGAGLARVLLQQEMRALQPPPDASPVFRASFNKAAGFAERHFSQRCFPSRVGGWQHLTESADLSLVRLLWSRREARSRC